MLLQVGVRAPDETDPLGLLATGLRLHLVRLRGLAFAGGHLHATEPELRERAAAALRDGLIYFARASDDPFREEVELIFPRLLAHRPSLGEICQTLSADRARAAALFRALDDAAAELLDAPSPGSAQALTRAADALLQLYLAHLGTLEAQVLPSARMLLDAADRQSLGEAMLDMGWATVAPEDGDGQSAPDGLP